MDLNVLIHQETAASQPQDILPTKLSSNGDNSGNITGIEFNKQCAF